MGEILSTAPSTLTASTVHEHSRTGHTYGPFTREDTAKAVAKGKGERGDGSISSANYVAWRDAQGMLWGLQVIGTPVRLLESAPEEAALESILCKLPLAERVLLEARLAGR